MLLYIIVSGVILGFRGNIGGIGRNYGVAGRKSQKSFLCKIHCGTRKETGPTILGFLGLDQCQRPYKNPTTVRLIEI